jgi:hypothetical protein
LAFLFVEGDLARLLVVRLGARMAASGFFDTPLQTAIRASCVPTVTECALTGPRRYATVQLFGDDAGQASP